MGHNESSAKGTFVTLSAFIKKSESSHTSKFITHLKAVSYKKETHTRRLNSKK